MRDPLAGLWFVPLSVISVSAYCADYLTVSQAQKAIFGEQAIFLESPLELSNDQRKAIKKAAGTRQRQQTQAAWQVMGADGKLVGWFFVDDVIGKHEYISYALGVSVAGEILGMEIMSYRESHGDEVREASWREKFVGKHLGDPFKLDEDVPNISGATLSCRNLLDGAKRLLVIYDLYLQQ
ncbi:FMN-binding protein [Halioxenophilus sp. WMMB6]|uniref:FMN-binding protein n=1 Tax=Halioxenophilus sp. WMMB6 TaxID=3073815 RepID=UPI00295F308D|nr:FMN-binding protein [Halioxenophilus sp. WMMB6]